MSNSFIEHCLPLASRHPGRGAFLFIYKNIFGLQIGHSAKVKLVNYFLNNFIIKNGYFLRKR